MNSEVLKSIALKAKRRLATGESKPKVAAKIKVISNDDVTFKEKVEFLMSKEDEIFNPIHFLMDDKILKNLDSEGKERYLLRTIDKYNRFRSQIIEEQYRGFGS